MAQRTCNSRSSGGGTMEHLMVDRSNGFRFFNTAAVVMSFEISRYSQQSCKAGTFVSVRNIFTFTWLKFQIIK